MAIILSRPAKLDHVDTIHYEISMLRFTTQRLAKRDLVERDAWVYLEAFLLHYRNLIDFLGAENPRPDDLHVTTIWALARLSPPPNLVEICAKGKSLRSNYEPTDSQGGGRISQYLQHCTTKRVETKDWRIDTMIGEIEPLLAEVEKYLGPANGILSGVHAIGVLDPLSASTTVGTFTSAIPTSFQYSYKKPV